MLVAEAADGTAFTVSQDILQRPPHIVPNLDPALRAISVYGLPNADDSDPGWASLPIAAWRIEATEWCECSPVIAAPLPVSQPLAVLDPVTGYVLDPVDGILGSLEDYVVAAQRRLILEQIDQEESDPDTMTDEPIGDRR